MKKLLRVAAQHMRRDVRLRTTAFVALLALACGSPPAGPGPPPELSLLTDSVFSGGSIQATSSAFSGVLFPLEVHFDDGSILTTEYIGDSTVTVQVPEIDRTGRHEVRFSMGDVTLFSPSITILGYSSTIEVDGWIQGRELHPYPWDVPLFALGFTETSIALLDLVDGSLNRITDVQFSSWYGPGVSFVSTEVIVPSGMDDSVDVWQLLPVVQKIGREYVENLWLRQTWRLSSDQWVVTGHHNTWVSAGKRYDKQESPWAIVFSPALDLATISVNHNSRGVPVYSLSTGDTLYHVEELLASEGAAFSPDGSDLFLLSNNCCTSALRVVRVEAASGIVQVEFADSTLKPIAIASDPAGEWVYAVAEEEDGVVGVLVLDALTLELVGRMRTPPDKAPCPCSSGFAAVPHAVGKRLAVIPGSGGGDRLIHFDLLGGPDPPSNSVK